MTTIYLEGVWEELSNGAEARRYYTLNGTVVTVRHMVGSTSTLSSLHGDHLGSAGGSMAGVAGCARADRHAWNTVASQ